VGLVFREVIVFVSGLVLGEFFGFGLFIRLFSVRIWFFLCVHSVVMAFRFFHFCSKVFSFFRCCNLAFNFFDIALIVYPYHQTFPNTFLGIYRGMAFRRVCIKLELAIW
jgi:hypothetical protein